MSKVQTDFRLLLPAFAEEITDQDFPGKEDQTPEERAEELEDQLQLVKVEHRDLVPIFTPQVLQKFDSLGFKGLDLKTQIELQGSEVKKVIPGKVGIASQYEGEAESQE